MSGKNSRCEISRREFVALGAGAFVIASIPIGAARRERLVRRTMPIMGTIAELAVVHRDELYAHSAMDAAMAELTRIENLMTRFRFSSDIGRANYLASDRPVRINAETALVVEAALRWAEFTGGAYDPAIGGAVALWDVTHRHEPPPEAAVSRYRARALHRKVELGTSNRSPVMLYHDPDVSIDLGSIAKGYAVDRAAAVLRECGIRGGLVNVGGDLYAIGTSIDGSPWRVGIQDPADEAAMIGIVEVADGAIATSGTYIQHFRYRGHDYHHLLDPSTGAPRETRVRSFTVRSDSCMHADVAATAAYGLTPEKANAIFARCAPGTAVVRIA